MNGKYSALSVYVVSLTSLLASFLFGYEIGTTTLILNNFRQILFNNSIYESIIVSSVSLGAVSCLFFLSTWNDVIGRKPEILLAGTAYSMGSLITASSSNMFSVLFTGRFIYGIGVGFTTHAAPLLISEHVSSELRGIIVTLKEGAIVFGIIIGNIVGEKINSLMVYLVSFCLGIGLIYVGIIIPETPRYLAFIGKEEEMETSIQWMYPRKEDAKTIKNRMHQVLELTPRNTRLEIHVYQIALGLVTLQQLSGQPAMLYYLDDLLTSKEPCIKKYSQ